MPRAKWRRWQQEQQQLLESLFERGALHFCGRAFLPEPNIEIFLSFDRKCAQFQLTAKMTFPTF